MIEVTRPIKVLSLFSGIGAFEKALDNLSLPYELVAYCEIDRFASASYSRIHSVSEEKNLRDVTTVDTSLLPHDIDLITYGFPCQDISTAGKRAGFAHEDGSTTRSGLFFEALRIITDTQPRIAIAENVKNLVSDAFRQEFYTVLSSLFEAGYNSYFCLLNAKDFGVPQNREREFIVSVRKDLPFVFTPPAAIPLTKCLRDVLEADVDEKYFLSEKMIKNICGVGPTARELNPDIDRDVSYALTATMHKMHRANWDNYVSESFIKDGERVDLKKEVQKKEKTTQSAPTLFQVAQIYPASGNPQAGRIYSEGGISPTLDTAEGGNRQPKIFVKEATRKGYSEAQEGDSINYERATANTRRGRVGKGVSHTILADASMAVVVPKLRIRRLTPLECFRLMGFSDEDFRRASEKTSDTQLYHMAGNSIVVDVLMAIFKQIYTTKKEATN